MHILKEGDIKLTYAVDIHPGNNTIYISTNIEYKAEDESCIINENIETLVLDIEQKIDLHRMLEFKHYIESTALYKMIPGIKGFIINKAEDIVDYIDVLGDTKEFTTIKIESDLKLYYDGEKTIIEKV